MKTIHKQDIELLMEELCIDEMDRRMIRYLGNEYGEKQAYRYLDLCLESNKPISAIIFPNLYELSIKLIKYVKQVKNGRKRLRSRV